MKTVADSLNKISKENTYKICKGLSLRKNADGHWLSFSSKDGKHASLCLENQRGIAGAAMLAWAKETVKI